MKVLMVCHGNICRSPLAEGILRDKVKKLGLPWEVDSAGTKGYQPGCPPYHLSQKVAKDYGVDICEQKCRDFTRDDIDNFDRIYVMDDENYYAVQKICGQKWDATKVDFLLNEVYPEQNVIVPDPYLGSEEEFHEVYEMMDKACEAIVKKYALART